MIGKLLIIGLSVVVLLISLFFWELSSKFNGGSDEVCVDPKKISIPAEGTFYSCPYENETFNYVCDEIREYITDGETYLGLDFEQFEEKDDLVIFDVGANIGLFSFYASKKFPSATIHSFEPIKDNFDIFQKNIEANELANVIPVNKGMSDKEEVLKFRYENWNPGATSSFNFGDVTSDLVLCLRKIHALRTNDYYSYLILSIPFMGNLLDFIISMATSNYGTGEETTSNVKYVEGNLITFSKYIEENEIKTIDILKIDVEGAEYQILNGLEEQDWGKIHYITMEVHPYFFRKERKVDEDSLGIKIQKLLESKGFRVVLINKCAQFGYIDLDRVFQNLVAVWCHNPESISGSCEMSFNPNSCIGCDECVEICDKGAIAKTEMVGDLKIDPLKCNLCGDCADICKMSSLQMIGNYSTDEELFNELMKDKEYFLASGGGVTFSGGEPLLQYESIEGLLQMLKDEGIHVLVETCANVPWKIFEDILEKKLVDEFYIDIKVVDREKHNQLTGQPNDIILSNIEKLLLSTFNNNSINLRMPLVPGLNDSEEDLILLSEKLVEWNHPEIHLLNYHSLYEEKQKRLDFCRHEKTIPLGIKSPNFEDNNGFVMMDTAEQILSDHGVTKIITPPPVYQKKDLLAKEEGSLFFPDRIYRLKEAVESADREVCTDRSNITTRFYSLRNKVKRNGIRNLFKKNYTSPQIERAEFMAFLFRNQKKIIYDDELLVGNYTSKRVSGPNHCELHGLGSLEDIFKFHKRSDVPLQLSFREKIDLLKLYPLWGPRNVITKTYGLKKLYKRSEEMLSGEDFFINEFAGIAHFVPDWKNILRLGISGLKEEARKRKEEVQVLKLDDNQEDEDSIESKIDFYTSLEIICDGLSDLCNLYADEAERNIMVLMEEEGERKKDLEIIRDVCRKISEDRPETFHEALQLMLFIQIGLNLEAVDQGICPGRLDVLLEKYYEKDLKEGIIDELKARELTACFFIKLNELIPLFSTRASKFHQGLPNGQVVSVGGTSPAPNFLTFMMLDCQNHLSMRQPNFYARIPSEEEEGESEMNQKYMKKISSILRDGRGLPALANDGVVIPLLLDRDFDIEDAEDYIMIGCVEPGNSALYGSTDSGLVNLGKAFERALMYFKDNSISPKSADEVFKKYEEEVELLLKKYISHQSTVEKILQDEYPVPLSSLCLRGCLESGKDANSGGAKYNASGVQGVGVIEIADSFAAIDHIVNFNDGKERKVSVTWEELMEILEDDFVGNESLQTYLRERTPKFGNDGGTNKADEYAKRVMNHYSDFLRQFENQRGGYYCAGQYSMTTHIRFGQATGALPSGRGKGMPFTSGLSPTGMGKAGPTKQLDSVAALDPRRNCWNGYSFNLSIDTFFMEDGIGENAIEGLVRGFFKKGGMQTQMNIIDPKILLEAKENPEKFTDLLVRVSGYSAYFNDLGEEMKDEIISRFVRV